MTFNARYEQLKSEGKIFGAFPKERILTLDVPQIRGEIITRLSAVDGVTCELCDALDALGYIAGEFVIPAYEIAPLLPQYRAVGVAVTTRSCPEQVFHKNDYETHPSHLFQKDLPYLRIENAIWMAEAKGLTCSHFGDMTAQLHKDCGMKATILDGFIRDSEAIKKIGYPFWSRGLTPISGKRRAEIVEINGIITMGGVQVRPGDLVAADANGIVVVPHDLVEEVFAFLTAQNVC